jgi:hypothetical protein
MWTECMLGTPVIFLKNVLSKKLTMARLQLTNRYLYYNILCFVLPEKGLPGGFPRIKQNPAMKVVEKGRNALLVCEAEGDPTVNIYWVKDTMKLTPNPRLTVMQQGKLRGE